MDKKTRSEMTIDDQLDCIEQAIIKNKNRIGAVGGQMEKVGRMLHWLVAEMIHTDKDVVDEMRLKAECNQPDISDILEGKGE